MFSDVMQLCSVFYALCNSQYYLYLHTLMFWYIFNVTQLIILYTKLFYLYHTTDIVVHRCVFENLLRI